MTTQAKKPNIYQRIHKVMEEVAYVKKDATVEAGGGRSYKGVSHDAVVAALRPAMVKNGIALHVTQTDERAIDGQTARGNPKIRYEGWYEIALVNVDEPEDRSVYRMHAHAEDGGDKAPGKAVSYAVKTVLLKAFDLETGENDESRFLPDEPMISEKQQAEIERKARCQKAAEENADSVTLIKEGIAEGDLVKAAEAWFELDDDTKMALFVAPSKGGPFTTEERAAMKTTEFRQAFYGQEEPA